MDRVELLHQSTAAFRRTLLSATMKDWSLLPWLLQMLRLFRDIESGKIVPPAEGIYRWPFHVDHHRYGPKSSLYHAGAEFQAALEDWRSQPWAQAAYRDDER